MSLKEMLEKKRNAVLEEERQKQEAEAQRQADEAVVPHPLRGRAAGWLDDYVRGQLVLRKEGNALDEAGVLLRPFAIGLGLSLEHFSELQEEVSYYDEQSSGEMLQKLCSELKEPEEIICFLCDIVKLHGEEYTLEGDFLELWRSVCMGLFHVGSEETALMENFCRRVAKREGRKRGDDFGDMPQELMQYYLSLPGVGNGQYLVIDSSGGYDVNERPFGIYGF